MTQSCSLRVLRPLLNQDHDSCKKFQGKWRVFALLREHCNRPNYMMNFAVGFVPLDFPFTDGDKPGLTS